MSLLSVLNLPVPKRLLAPREKAAAQSPTPHPTALPSPPAKTADKPARSDASDVRAEALELRGAIETRRKQTAELLLRMQRAEPVLKARLDAASGDEKKRLADQRALLGKKIADAERAITRAETDLEAIDNPGSKREELLAILARQQSAGKVGEDMDISSAGLDPYKKGKVNTDVSTTTTAYGNGKATTEKVREQQKLGLDGYTKTQSHDKEVTDGKLTARAGEEKKTNVSLGGKVSVEEKKSAEVELRDGRKAGVESTQAKEFSTKGASHATTVKKTNFDGSSSSVTSKHEVERGDGKVTATTSNSVTKTNQSGAATTTDKGASGGVVAGKDGIGAQAGVAGGKSVTSKKGMQAAINASVHANVLCKVGEPSGEPKRYPVTVTVSFGGSVAVSGGAGKKEGSKASASVEVKRSVERSMVVTHQFTEAELGDYTSALQAASKGSQVAATQQEFAIIAAGVNQGWDVARQMWESGGKEISKKTTDTLKRSGDSAQVSETRTTGAGVKGNVGPVGAGYGETDTHTKSTKATRNAKGGLDVDNKQEQGREKTGSLSLQAGVVNLEIGKTHVHKTRFGYSISIDPKNDPDGKILEALGYCKTEMHYEIFIATHPGKITVIGKSKGTTDADSTQIGVSIGGAKLKLGTHKGVDEDVTTDGKGKVVSKKTESHAGASGGLGGLADSTDDDAVAESDDKGNATLTMTSTTKANYGSRVREKKKQKMLEQATGTGKQSGALTQAAGGEEDDSATQDVSGLTLSNKDLRRIGGVACRSMPAWTGMTRRWQENDDWKAAGIAIAKGKGVPSVVAHALARFIGGDEVERKNTVMQMIRGGYHSTIGKAFEFPDSLRDLHDDYNLVTDDKLPDRMNTYANKNGDPAAATECQRLLAIVDRIQARVQACKDFANIATKTEMMSELLACRTMLNQAVVGFSGKLKPQEDPKVLAEEGDRLMKQCNACGVEQEKLVAKLHDQDAYTVSERASGKKLIKQLEDMQLRWRNDFYRLKDNYAKRKLVLPELPYAPGVPQIHPTEALVATFEKKFVR